MTATVSGVRRVHNPHQGFLELRHARRAYNGKYGGLPLWPHGDDRKALRPGIYCSVSSAGTTVVQTTHHPPRLAGSMTVKTLRTSVVRADGARVKPVVKSLSKSSATKTQRLRAARVKTVLGETAEQKPQPKSSRGLRTLTAARVMKLKQQKRTQ